MLVPAPALRFLACLLALVPFSLAANAQDPTPTPGPVQMSLASPLAITVQPMSLMARPGKWFPVAVTLSNTGDPVSGDLRLRLTASGSFDNPPNDSYCSVDLPTNAHKVVWLYGRMDRANIAGIQVTFAGRGFTAQEERVPITEPEDGQRVVLTISDNDSGISTALKDLKGTGLSLNGAAAPTGFNPSGSQGPVKLFETPRENVPDRWFGFDAADMVILGDFPHNALLPPQIDALRGYVAGGGTLLVMGGANATRLRSSPLADLWPGQVGNSAPGSPAEVASLVSRYVNVPLNGADRLGGSPVVVTRLALKPDAVLHAGTQAQPLYSSIDEGAGRVLFLGFDPSQPPFNGWSGQLGLWQDIFASTHPRRRMDGVDTNYVTLGSPTNNYSRNYGYNGYNGYNYEGDQYSTPTGGLLSALAKAPQLSMPPVSQIAWFLSLYVFVLVPLNYTVLRLIDRRELAWVTIPVIVALFSAFAYAAALSIRGTAILTRQVDLVQGTLGSTQARTDSLLWLFSPKRTTYDISSYNKNAAVDDFSNDSGGKQGAFSILQPADTSPFKVESANVWMWTDRAFVSQSLSDLKNGITLSGNQVKNGTPFDLNSAVWVQDHRVRKLGPIKSGATASIPSQSVQLGQGTDLNGSVIASSNIDSIFDEKTVANGIPTNALNVALGGNYGQQNEGALLIAWARKPFSPIQIGIGGAHANDLTLLVLHVPVSLKGQLASREAVVTPLANGATQNPNQRGASLYNCVLPPAASWKLHVRGTRYNNGYAPPGAQLGGKHHPGLAEGVGFQVWDNAKRNWVPLQGTSTRENSPSGGWNFDAVISPNMLRLPDRLMRLRLIRSYVNDRISSVSVVAN